MVKQLAVKKVTMKHTSPFEKKKMKIDYLKNKEWEYRQYIQELQEQKNQENMQKLLLQCKQIENADIKHHIRRNTVDQMTGA
jgi:hypothetical protein